MNCCGKFMGVQYSRERKGGTVHYSFTPGLREKTFCSRIGGGKGNVVN